MGRRKVELGVTGIGPVARRDLLRQPKRCPVVAGVLGAERVRLHQQQKQQRSDAPVIVGWAAAHLGKGGSYDEFRRQKISATNAATKLCDLESAAVHEGDHPVTVAQNVVVVI